VKQGGLGLAAGVGIAALLACTQAMAQQGAPAGAVTIPAGTVVELEIDQPVTSGVNKDGEHFRFHLSEPITIDGVAVVPAGAPGSGDVVHSRHSGWDGKPGELILAARYIEAGGVRIPLSRLRYGKVGKDNTGIAFATDITIGLGFLISGGEVKVSAGSRVNAKVAADVVLPASAAPPEPSAPTAPSTGEPSQ
jgi:hypothetical protein